MTKAAHNTNAAQNDAADAETDTPNEILLAAKEAKAHAEAAAASIADRAKTWPIAKIGMGVIGSAAVAAAVLFANQSRKK